MRRPSFRWTLASLGLLALMTSVACSGSDSPEVTVEELIAMGWDDFTGGRAADARDAFQQALEKEPENIEALLGLGWSLARLDDLPNARDAFIDLRDLGSSSADAYAGAAVVERAWASRTANPAENARAIALADSALERVPDYAFEHDARVTWEDLRLIIAQSAYILGDFDRVLVEIDALGGAVPDPESPTLALDIVEELEALYVLFGGDGAAGEFMPRRQSS